MHALEVQKGKCSPAKKNKREHAGIKRDQVKEEEPVTHLHIGNSNFAALLLACTDDDTSWLSIIQSKKDLTSISPEGYKKAHHYWFFYRAMVQKAGTWTK